MMALNLGGFLLGAWLIPLHGLEVAGATPVVEEATCEKRLETMTSELQKIQETGAAPLTESLLGDPAEAHWPASRSAYVPPLVEYFHELKVFLNAEKPQWMVAAVAGAFGALNLASGPTSFKTTLLVGVGLMGAASGQYEATLLWPSLNMVQQIGIAAAAGLLSAFIVFQAFHGALTVLGFLLGLGITVLLEPYFHTELWPLNVSLGWYSAWGLIGVLLITFFQRHTLSLLTPCLGGFLLSSCLGYLVQRGALSSHQPGTNVPDWMAIHGDNWLDFADALLGTTSAGVFAIHATPGFVYDTVDIDRCLGRLLWFVLFYMGWKFQWKIARSSNWDGSINARNIIPGVMKASPVSHDGEYNTYDIHVLQNQLK